MKFRTATFMADSPDPAKLAAEEMRNVVESWAVCHIQKRRRDTEGSG